MKDLISRQMAIAVADSSDYVGLSVEDVKKVTDEVVKGLKQLQPAQPKTGHWVQDDIASNIFRCSECGCDAPVDPTAGCEIKSNFCYMCGADMRGGK